MTDSETMELQSILKTNSASSLVPKFTQQSSTESINGSATTMMISTHATSLSDLTDDGLVMNYDPQFITRIPSTVVALIRTS